MRRHRFLLFLFLLVVLTAPMLACDDDAPYRRSYESYIACIRACPECDCEIYR